MNPNEFDDAYEDRQRIRGAIVTDPISTLRPKTVATVRPATMVLDAVHLMAQKKIGCVCVTENDKLLGIFTERDVLTKIVEPNVDPRTTPISQVMTKNPDTLTPRDRMAHALNKMHVGGFRHIPLVEGGKLVGIISQRDIADFIVEMFPEGVLNVPYDPKLGIPTRPEGA
jgi:CBS domain-containing protein